jgi:hypothetical protein
MGKIILTKEQQRFLDLSEKNEPPKYRPRSDRALCDNSLEESLRIGQAIASAKNSWRKYIG